MDEEKMSDLIAHLHGHTDLIIASNEKSIEYQILSGKEDLRTKKEAILQKCKEDIIENRRKITSILMRDLRFVNKNGAPLNFMPLLKLDPALLEQPLYH